MPVAPSPDLVRAVAALDPQPRGPRWTSLTYCVTDAVWSINANYATTVAPLVRRLASAFGDDHPLTSGRDHPLPPAGGQPLAGTPAAPDPVPLTIFLERFPDEDTLLAATNRQRTSTTGGITKAAAVLRHARILLDHEVPDLATAAALPTAAWESVNRALAEVPGEGQSGVRRSYLWMLIGDDNLAKIDRMVLRWLARHGVHATIKEAHALIVAAAPLVSELLGRPVTPWMVDHAIWLDERTRPPA